MPVYPNSRMHTYSDYGHEMQPCQVRIGDGDGSIVVSYHDRYREDELVLYEGNEVESGHYTLIAQAVRGTATLHKIPNEDILEGSWREGGFGMWRIELEE